MTATARSPFQTISRSCGLLPPVAPRLSASERIDPGMLVPAGVEAILGDSSSLAPHQAAQLREHIAMLTRSVHELGQISRDAMAKRSAMRKELKAAISDRDRLAARATTARITRRRRAAQ